MGMVGNHALGPRLAQRPHVVDDVGTRIQHGLHDLGFVGIDRNWHAKLHGRLHKRQYAAHLFFQGDGRGAGAGGFTTNVQDMGTVFEQFFGMAQCRGHAVVVATIRKRIGGVVHNAHHQRAGEI